MRLKDKVCIITGAGRGIGKAIALAFAEESAIVIVSDIDIEAANATTSEITAIGGSARSSKTDVSQKTAVEDLIRGVEREFGCIDVLVNNAGIQTETPFLNLSEREWDQVIAVNLKGTFLCSQLVARTMAKHGRGKIINISSIHQSIPRRNVAHYAASKAGVEMLTKVMALELAQYRINVTCIAPGATATPMNSSILASSSKLAETEEKIPLGRLAQPGEIAKCAVFLASGDADYITGSTIYVDGGMNLGQR